MDQRIGRLERQTAKLDQRRLAWLKHLPWGRMAIFFAAAILLITGHLTVSELKTWLGKALLGGG